MFHFPISVFRFLIQYFFRWLEQFCPDDSIASTGKNTGDAMSGYRRRGGKKYSDKEEVKLVRFIVERKAYDRMNQSGLWKELEEEKILKNRTARGMQAVLKETYCQILRRGRRAMS